MLYTDEFLAAEIAYRRERAAASYTPKSTHRPEREHRQRKHDWLTKLSLMFDRPRRVPTHA
jgi:hypothetical protein